MSLVPHTDPRLCAHCGVPGTWHMAPPTKYTVSNCARTNDADVSKCSMCQGGKCLGAHVYLPDGEQHLARLSHLIPTDRPLAIIDCETTGVPNAVKGVVWKGYENFAPQLIDIAVSLLMPDGSIKSAVTTRVWAAEACFNDWRAKKALELTGLSYKDDAPPAAQVGEAIRRWMKKHECEDLVAFNDQFEQFYLNPEPYAFAQYTWHDLLKTSKELLEPVGAIPTNPKYLGLNMIVAWAHGHSGGQVGWKALSHGAVEDVRVTAQLTHYLRKIQEYGFGHRGS